MALTFRNVKGNALTITELDNNFHHFTGSHEVSGSITATDGNIGGWDISTNQLSAGNIKVYKDSNEPLNNISDKKYILKISGIWENNNDFGITYKTILASKL